jgi:hypothetical protein
MSVVSSFAKIRPRRGTLAAWSLEDPILEEGEMVVEVPDTGIGTGISKMKIGDGIHHYTELPYSLDGTSAASIIGGSVSSFNMIQIRSGSSAEWAELDPIIATNEIVYDRSRNSIKIGDGVTRYSELPFINSGGVLTDIDGGSEG